DTLKTTPKIQFAPLAGVSDLPTRMLSRRFGAEMAFTEMVSSTALVMTSYKTERLFSTMEGDTPLGVQIFGSDPEIMAKASAILEKKGVSHIDINMGCPVRKVVKTNSGAALLKDRSLTKEILEKIISSISIPVSIKIRAGWSETDKGVSAQETALLAEKCGVSTVTIHGRTAAQGYSGKADWSVIQKIKALLKIPVIGNGDVQTAVDAERMLKDTGCDGVMIGRGAIGNPWVFKESRELLHHGKKLPAPSLEERAATIIDHLYLMVDYYGPGIGVKKMRMHILQYTKGFPKSAAFRKMITQVECPDEVAKNIRHFFKSLETSDEKHL
ncbi:MAG: tRNA dihydrouridine synthase DusB, partial [Nitrospinota bacterium]